MCYCRKCCLRNIKMRCNLFRDLINYVIVYRTSCFVKKCEAARYMVGENKRYRYFLRGAIYSLLRSARIGAVVALRAHWHPRICAFRGWSSINIHPTRARQAVHHLVEQ